MKLLHVDSSIPGPSSVSRELSAAVVALEQALHPEAEIVRLDLAATPIAHLTGLNLAAGQGAPPDDTAIAPDVAAGVDAVEQFLEADVVVVGAPMHDLGIPSLLKAWIDRLAIAGRTFRSGEAGVEGLAADKTVIVASSRGGFYGGGAPTAFLDRHESYLRGVFGFLGITDITFIRADGVALGEPQRAQAIAGAQASIQVIAA